MERRQTPSILPTAPPVQSVLLSMGSPAGGTCASPPLGRKNGWLGGAAWGRRGQQLAATHVAAGRRRLLAACFASRPRAALVHTHTAHPLAINPLHPPAHARPMPGPARPAAPRPAPPPPAGPL